MTGRHLVRISCGILFAILPLWAATTQAEICVEWPETGNPSYRSTSIPNGSISDFFALEAGPDLVLAVGHRTDPYGPTPKYLFALEYPENVYAEPVVLGQLSLGIVAEDIAIVGTTAYLTAGGTTMQVVDLTDPAAMTIAGTLSLGASCRDLLADPDRDLLITAEWDAVRIYSTAYPLTPTLLASVPAAQAAGLARRGDLIYVASSSQGLRVIDTTVPDNPQQIAHIPVGGTVRNVALWQDRALLVGPYTGLVEVDITQPSAPTVLRALPCSGEAEQVVIHNGYAYVRSERVEPLGVTYLDDLHLFRLTPSHGPLWSGTYFRLDLQVLAKKSEYLLIAAGTNARGILSVPYQCPPAAAAPEPSPPGLALSPPGPNPFNPSTRCNLLLPAGHSGSLAIHDLQGRRIRTLWSGTGTGTRRPAHWDGRLSDGRTAPSGTYLFVLRDNTTGARQTRRASLIK